MKKLLLSLGALSAVVAPVAAVVACGSKTETPAKHVDGKALTFASTKTEAQLKGLTSADFNAPNADVNEVLGLAGKSIGSAKGTVYTWDAANLKLTGKYLTLTTNFVVTPAVAPVVADTADLKLGKLLSTDLAKNISKTDTVLEDQAKAFVAKVVAGPIGTVSFNLDDGELVTFDFGTDSFLHNGNKLEDGGTPNTGADTMKTYGEYANYISDRLSASFKLEDGKLAAVKTDVNDATFIKDAKFLIRMIVAAKTNLHYVSNKAWLLA